MSNKVKHELVLKEIEDIDSPFDLGDFLVGFAIGMGVVALGVFCVWFFVTQKRKQIANHAGSK